MVEKIMFIKHFFSKILYFTIKIGIDFDWIFFTIFISINLFIFVTKNTKNFYNFTPSIFNT